MEEYEARAYVWDSTKFQLRFSPFWVDSDRSLYTLVLPFHLARETYWRRSHITQMDTIRILQIKML